MIGAPKNCLITHKLPLQLTPFAYKPCRQKKTQDHKILGFLIKSLAIPYFHMATCHTIIGAKRFHFRVRDGIGWFTFAMFTKQTWME